MLYDDLHPDLLASAIFDHLSLAAGARAIVMTPLRDDFTVANISTFQQAMARGDSPLTCVDQGEVFGQDDWALGGTDPVKYWWGMFARRMGRDETEK